MNGLAYFCGTFYLHSPDIAADGTDIDRYTKCNKIQLNNVNALIARYAIDVIQRDRTNSVK